jgi:hypothetical protein
MNWARTARIGSRILRIAKPVINTLFPETRVANPLIDMATLALQRAGRKSTIGIQYACSEWTRTRYIGVKTGNVISTMVEAKEPQ